MNLTIFDFSEEEGVAETNAARRRAAANEGRNKKRTAVARASPKQNNDGAAKEGRNKRRAAAAQASPKQNNDGAAKEAVTRDVLLLHEPHRSRIMTVLQRKEPH
jgi:hypothetical protein